MCRDWTRGALCADCVGSFVAELPRCGQCGVRLAVAAPACGACLRDPPPFRRCLCAFDYAFPWDRLIRDFKFNGRIELAQSLTLPLLHLASRQARDHPDVLLPVPLSSRRLAERGFNQAWEITRRLARPLGIATSASWLERLIDTPHQADLPLAQRLKNLRGAFAVGPASRGRIAQRHVALVDDVMTSGATLREAAATLRRAGAGRVDVWVLARTPPPPQT